MNRMKILMIMVTFFGLIASPAIAVCILPNADFFYGIKADNQSGISVLDGPRKSVAAEIVLNEEKGTAGLIASPAIAGCILPNADLFYGVKADSQSGISVSDNPRESLVAEVDLKEKKGTATLPDDMLRPEIFYGYTDFIADDDE